MIPLNLVSVSLFYFFFFLLSLATKTWKKLETKNTPDSRSGHIAFVHENTLIVVGGVDKKAKKQFSGVEKLDLSEKGTSFIVSHSISDTLTWAKKKNIWESGRFFHAHVTDKHGFN